jgi:hypothetical protein
MKNAPKGFRLDIKTAQGFENGEIRPKFMK